MMADEERQGIIPGGEQIAQEPTLVGERPEVLPFNFRVAHDAPKVLALPAARRQPLHLRKIGGNLRPLGHWLEHQRLATGFFKLAHFLAELAAGLFAELLHKILFKRCA